MDDMGPDGQDTNEARTARRRRTRQPGSGRGARLAIWAAVAVVAGIALFVASSLYTDRAPFCTTCHEMVPYYDAWTQGPHADKATCIDCHVNAGYPERFAHKFVALGEVWSHFTGNTTFPRPAPPEIPNRRCTRCHTSLPAKTEGGFDHAIHAEKAACADCHAQTGHRVDAAALQAAGIFNPSVKRSPLGGDKARIDAGSANIPGHVKVACERCHDMNKTGCQSCHTPSKEHGDKGPCQPCHAAGASWVFKHPDSTDCGKCHQLPKGHYQPRGGTLPSCDACHLAGGKSWEFKHPRTGADCSKCHTAPANHPAGQCSECHHRPGVTFAFVHPPSGEHSWRQIACVKCHPNGFGSAYCSCHGGKPPRD